MERISDQAARWAVRADANSLGSDELRELEDWLGADPRHRGAYVMARARLIDLDRLAALHGRASPAEEDPPRRTDIGGKPVGTKVRGPLAMSRRQLLAAGVAGVALVGGGASWLLLREGSTRFVSDVGEVRRLALEDGSTLLLNTASEVRVSFTPQRRSIQLVRGEALFEVAHDKARPFLVVAHDTAVRAVGTAFAVRLEPAQVDVTVTEGMVEVANVVSEPSTGAVSLNSTLSARRVAANERVVIASSRAPDIRPIAPAEADRQLAWREGMVSFDGESLGRAVAEINRHNRRKIVVEDATLAAKPVVGVFRTTDLQGFSAAAAAALKARSVVDGDVIRLEPGIQH